VVLTSFIAQEEAGEEDHELNQSSLRKLAEEKGDPRKSKEGNHYQKAPRIELG